MVPAVLSRALALVATGVPCFGLVAACSSSDAGGTFVAAAPDAAVGSGVTVGQLVVDGSILTGDASCVGAIQVDGRPLRLDVYILVDQSVGMASSVADGGTRWSALAGALTTFVGQPGLAGASVGLQYFGVAPSGSGSGDSCSAADYARPDVEIAPLPGVAPAVLASIGKHTPSTAAATSAALQGGADHAASWAKTHAGHDVVVVLATGGEPAECDTSVATMDGIAAAAAMGPPSILTFVIDVGASLASLDSIAAAGGTTTALSVDPARSAQQQILDALNEIHATASGCKFAVPAPEGGLPDYSKINMEYVSSAGGAGEIILQVPDKAHCPADGLAWYYENFGSQARIDLCDRTCAAVRADATGQVRVLTGCRTLAR